MGVYAWSMPPASAVVVLGRMPRAVSMEWQRDREAGACVSVLLHLLVVGSAPLRLRAIGADENIGAPVCSSCDTNASR